MASKSSINDFIVCNICHKTQLSKGMIEVSPNLEWVCNTKICRSCIKNIVKISKGGVNEPTSFHNWIDEEKVVTADEYNEMIQKWYNTHENGQDELLLMVMQWISTNKKSSLLPFLWKHSEKPEYKNKGKQKVLRRPLKKKQKRKK